ncbi:MAG: hypothetical protein AAGO57_03305 [Pseudomonadota bacterium]
MSASVPGTEPVFLNKWGFWGVIAGAVGLLTVFIQIGLPMMEPQPSVGTQIGEIAGDIRRAAWDSFLGRETAAPEPVAPKLTDYLIYVAPLLGILAVVLSLISGIRGENKRFALYGGSLGAAAIVFHFFWWAMLLVLGTLLLISIIENIGDIFGGGLFGG